MRFLLISFILLLQLNGISQNVSNSEILINHIRNTDNYNPYVPKYMFKDSPVLIKYNPITLVPGGLMFMYQRFISPQIFANCLFEESCSKFSVHLIHEFGFFKGASLSADRLTRCTQISAEDLSQIRINTDNNKVIDKVSWYKK
jgi:putative component of membrane protein insertase Oxa1/YidC/SpoIIIJ protein YidD